MNAYNRQRCQRMYRDIVTRYRYRLALAREYRAEGNQSAALHYLKLAAESREDAIYYVNALRAR